MTIPAEPGRIWKEHDMAVDFRNRNRAKIRVETHGRGGAETLERVEIEATHERYGHGKVILNREQVMHIAARLTQLDVAFGRNGHPDMTVQTTMIPRCGAEAFPITEIEGDDVHLTAVKVQAEGRGAVYLIPDQLSNVRHEVSRISRSYIGHNCWGGEDARNQ
jgi:hypothetical protein